MNSLWVDRLGSLASASCAVHCALGPALVSVIGLGILANQSVEWALFASAIGFAVAAAWFGYRLHRNPWILGGFATGVLVLAAGRVGEAFELYEGGLVFALVGGALLVTSHLASAR